MKTTLPGVLLVVAMLVSACGGARTAAPAPTEEVMVDQPTATAEPMMGEQTSTPEAMMDSSMGQGEGMTTPEAMTTAEPMMGEHETAPEAMSDSSMGEGESMATPEAMTTAEPMMGEHETTPEAMTDSSIGEGEAMATPEAVTTAEPMMGEHETTPKAMTDSSMGEGESMMDQGAMSVPAWFGVDLTNVNSGQTFKVSDFKGQVVLVETMAVWCTTCLRQQEQIQALHMALGEQDGLVSLSIDIDPNEDAGILKTHTEGHGFDWLFAVAPREVAHEIGQLYGDQFLNPPSAPMFIIDRQGQAHPLPFGVKSASALQEALSPYLNGG